MSEIDKLYQQKLQERNDMTRNLNQLNSFDNKAFNDKFNQKMMKNNQMNEKINNRNNLDNLYSNKNDFDRISEEVSYKKKINDNQIQSKRLFNYDTPKKEINLSTLNSSNSFQKYEKYEEEKNPKNNNAFFKFKQNEKAKFFKKEKVIEQNMCSIKKKKIKKNKTPSDKAIIQLKKLGILD